VAVTRPTTGHRAVALLDAIVETVGGTQRDEQRELCAAIADALDQPRHLVAEAPTGVGKTFAFTAAVVAELARARETSPVEAAPFDPTDGRVRVVVATATKALQDQLVDLDLPRAVTVAERLDMPFTFAVLKGRSNYLCLAAADEVAGSLLPDEREAAIDLPAAAREAGTGERARLPHVDDRVWSELSVAPGECPGANHCSRGPDCWAEGARAAAVDADVVVVNQSLYAAHLLADEAVLPPHRAVIVDEAHALADNIVDAGTVVLTSARLDRLASRAKRWTSPETGDRLDRASRHLASALSRADADTPDLDAGDLSVSVASARQAATDIITDLKEAGSDAAARALQFAATLQSELSAITTAHDDRVAWVENGTKLYSSPIDATETAAHLLWPGRTVVATSATLRAGADGPFATFLAGLGAPAHVETLAVASPFDYREQALLYVPRGRIPSPKADGWRAAVQRELWELVQVAGGRTLALFTSKAAAQEAAEALRGEIEGAGRRIEVVTQWDGPRDAVIGRLLREPATVVCATRSFWSGVDVPGQACVLVVVDQLPFPRPDDPLVQARRRRATARRTSSFLAVDLPHAAMHLAQGVGRLIRSSDDQGVVAVLDTRLATASWRHHVLDALPPMRRTVDIDAVRSFLHQAAARDRRP
jgi:ATP-dependent DNA helicase DinG